MKNKKILVGLLVLLVVGTFAIALSGQRTNPDRMTRAVVVGEVADDHHQGDDDKTRDFEIYPADVAEKIKNNEDVILLDVRQLDEYEDIHLQGAKLLPVEELSAQTLEAIGLGADTKDREIILYCRSGARSQVAYNIMSSLGYTNIKSSAGGMIHWQEDGYPYTESGAYKGPAWNTNTNADASNTNTSGAKISIAEDFYDFGVIPRSGGTVSRDFTITNPGTEDLEIGNLTTSCSCTSASVTNNTIKPGKLTTLTVVFDPDFHEEPQDIFKRTVFIPTNDPNTSEAEITIQVDIDEDN